MLRSHFSQLARYNQWANARLYEAAFTVSEADYRRDVGAFFKSLHGTLNHLLVTDRIWMRRLTGEGDPPLPLDAIVHESRRDLALARAEEDDRINAFVKAMDEETLVELLQYSNSKGKRFEHPRREVLAHLFNHQTHHRGQAHTVLSVLTGQEPPVLDLLAMYRGIEAPELRGLARG